MFPPLLPFVSLQAKRAFLQSRLLDPYTLFHMDTFSTLLWHTSSPLLLSLLAQELLDISRSEPEPWIALGNAFSLEKEHDEAMRCFRRAAQVANIAGIGKGGCAYAWTLSGHEAVSMEEFDRAIAFFQTAVRIDRRHFNAWFVPSCSP
jgi:anaphase-promoting complex subunit 3